MVNLDEYLDVDGWFGYSTKKIVFIRDRYLGFIYYGLVFMVVLYIFGVQILVQNEQFLLSSVQGIARMKASHPTQALCDASLPECKSAYRSLRELNYCRTYGGHHPASHQAHCKFEDATTIMPDGDVDNKFFIPTSVEIVTEKRKCKPGPENDYTCDNEYEELPGSDCLIGQHMCGTRGGAKDQFYFVADTKNFNIQFTSSYEQGEVHGTSLDHPAYYEVCDDRVRAANSTHYWADRLQHSESSESNCGPGGNTRLVKLPCQKGVNCRQKRDFDFLYDTGANQAIENAKRSADAVTEIVRNKDERGRAKSRSFLQHGHHHLGISSSHQQHQNRSASHLNIESQTEAHRQSFSAQKVEDLKSERSSDEQWASAYGDVFTLQRLMELAGADLDNSFNMDGWSTRESGSVLEVSVVYSNLHSYISSFGYKEVNYFYRVKELPLPYVSRRQLAKVQPPDYPETRRYEIRHGIIIWFKVVGEFGNFHATYLLIYLVTAFALIGAASSVTDFIAIYIHKRKNNYFNLKYDISGDFSCKWQCPKCSYWNKNLHSQCQGYEMWQDGEEAKRCGEPKPE